ncbi:EAL domain-containing protein [Paucibacter sp. DJ1R-11]|uniref:two-component system response regulator n=1 Tax=Paucibacter sp. DJ1R-11 TaxID=2893556 RepID=UPI0021E3B356|nr:GGDEF domain-containing response regulator [Paucibacter sp. DJ1R-11]MCV2363696.1 EAL domain-containing protein [Paucibacter sp. DJ1R-11]
MTDSLAEPVAPRLARIQIVEDERIVALDLKQDLESLGYEVSGMAASESRAVELARGDRPDLVLMDINLGHGGDGTRAAHTVISQLKIPVIYLTAYAEPATLERAGLTAPYGYLLKPFELRELNATIRMALARRSAEQQAERAEQRYRLALDAAQLGVVEFRPDSDDIELHGHIKPLFASEPRGFAISRQEFLACIDERARQQMSCLLAPGGSVHCVTRWRPEEEPPVWLEIKACHFPEEGKIIGVFRDISLQRESEAQLRRAAVVFESAADAILILDEQLRVRAVNPSFSQMTGWLLHEIVGRDVRGFLHAQRVGDAAGFHALGNPAAPISSSAAIWHGETICRHRDGRVFPAWQHLAPVLDTQGQLSHQVLTFTDISALRRAETQIQHLAYHDALTGLGNRHHLEICLRHFIAGDARLDAPGEGRDGARFALLFLDLDGFKTINDTLGHSVGDELLIKIARRLELCLRRSDVSVRLGGDEFIILLSDITRTEDATTLAEKLLAEIRLPVELEGREPVSVSASIGIAQFPDHANTSDALIQAADTAMYEAKAGGRNRYEVFSATLSDKAIARMQIEQGLRRARLGHELVLHWQPIIDMTRHRVIGAEALMRWNHPELGPISPDRFIPVAEEIGLIEDFGRWALDQACRLGVRWLASGRPLDRLAVNISARQLQRPGFVDVVAQALARHGLPPACLELEITESTLQSIDSGRLILGELRRLGVKLAIDDFGTGFSSLSLLKYFPLDRLKIDKSFVRDIERAGNDLAIVRAIVALADTLGLAITAEGVETEHQRQALLNLGVSDAQGWLYSAALPEAGLLALRSTLKPAGGGDA